MTTVDWETYAKVLEERAKAAEAHVERLLKLVDSMEDDVSQLRHLEGNEGGLPRAFFEEFRL